MYAYIKYVYEASKNSQTVVIAAQRHGALSYSIKACYWLRFYRVIERFLSSSHHLFAQFCLPYNLVWRKIMYAYVKYIYEAPKNGQTVVTATQCVELQHKSFPLAWSYDLLWNLWFWVFNAWFNLIFQFTSKDSGVRPVASYVVPSCCLTWYSSCKASLFTIWNLSQVVILKLERCVFFLFLEAYSVIHDSVLFIFLNSKILCFVRGAKL